MGDRRNVIIKYNNSKEVYFYTHWGGIGLPITVRDALERGKDRWGDATYLARIIFSEMIKDEVKELTGYGIAPFELDTEYNGRDVIIDTNAQQVIIGQQHWSYQEFLTAPNIQDV